MSTRKPSLPLNVIFNKAMRDKRLTIEAKAIFGYLFAYYGTPDEDFPTQEQMSEELRVTPPRFRRHIECLERYGYVERERLRDDWGMLGKYKYTIQQPYIMTGEEEH